MISYRVVDVRPELGLAALRDSLGRNHVVRIGAEAPGIGDELSGAPLRRHAQVQLAHHSGRVLDITVDEPECSQQYMLERLHALGAPAAVPGTARRARVAAPEHQGDALPAPWMR